MTHHIVTLPGDGIGPEIMDSAKQVLARLGDFETTDHLIGGASIDEHGTALTAQTLQACRDSDAVLLAAVGGPKWDTTSPDDPRPEQGLLGLRKGLELFANLRPVPPAAPLLAASPPRRGRLQRTDLPREPAGPRAPRGHRPAGRARADRRHLLWRLRPQRRHRVRHQPLLGGRDRPH